MNASKQKASEAGFSFHFCARREKLLENQGNICFSLQRAEGPLRVEKKTKTTICARPDWHGFYINMAFEFLGGDVNIREPLLLFAGTNCSESSREDLQLFALISVHLFLFFTFFSFSFHKMDFAVV